MNELAIQLSKVTLDIDDLIQKKKADAQAFNEIIKGKKKDAFNLSKAIEGGCATIEEYNDLMNQP